MFWDCLHIVYANYLRAGAEKIVVVLCFSRIFQNIEGDEREYTPVYGVFSEKNKMPERASGRFLRCRKCQGVHFAGSDTAREFS